jgi:diaminopimelate decarboxylase
MEAFPEINGTLYAEQIPLSGIAETAGTPAYIYSESAIRNNIASIQGAFNEKQPLIAYACKANGNLSILKIMASMGLGADIVSGEELQRCIAAGIDTGKIVFSGVGKTDEDIKLALKNSILQLNAESLPELKNIAEIAKKDNIKAPVSLRYNPDVDAKTHEKITTGRNENKFGIEEARIEEIYSWAAQHPNLDICGLSIHIGSQLTSIEPYEAAFRKVAELVKKLHSEHGHKITSLDLGGGIGIPYSSDDKTIDLPSFARLIEKIIYPLGIENIIIEPGRFLVGNAGILLSRVTYVKETSNCDYLILDAGMNDLIRPSMYGAYTDMTLSALCANQVMFLQKVLKFLK